MDLHPQSPSVGILAEIGYAIAQAGTFEQKLMTLKSEALRLHARVAAGALDRSVAADAILDAATSNGLLELYGAETVQQILASGLDGRTSGFKPATSNRRVVYNPDDLDAWLASHRRNSTSEEAA